MRNRSIAKALFCHLLTATLLNTGGVNGCISPSEEVHAFEGFEGENVVYLYLETAGFWSCTVLDEASGADMSGYFKTIMLNDSQPLVRVIRVFKSLPSTGRHSFRILQITCHCTVDGASKAFYRKAMLRAQRPDALQNVHSLVEFSVSKCTKKNSVIRELHKDFMVGDTALVFKVMREGTINVVELSMFQVTRNGVITVSGSLDEHEGHTYLLMLKLIKPDNKSSEIVPVAIHVLGEFQNSTLDDGSVSTVKPTQHAPRFVNTKCASTQECYVQVYSSEIPKHHKGKIFNLIPCEIQVEEAYKETVSYLLVGGNPSSYLDMFTINSENGDLYTLHLDLLKYSQSFFIIVQAMSNNPDHQHHESALVYVHVLVEEEAVKTSQTTATLEGRTRGTLSQTTTESLMPTTEAMIQTTKKAMVSRKGQIKPTAKKSRPPTQGKTTPGTRSRKGKSSLLDTTEDQSLVDLMDAEMVALEKKPKPTFSSSESSSETEEIRLGDVVPERLTFVNSCASFRSLSLMNILANALNTAAILINTLTVLCLLHVICILRVNNIFI